MTVKELKQKRTALLEEIGGADEKRFAEIKGEVEKINYQIGEMEKDTEAREAERAEEERRAAELRASREPNGSRSPESRAKDTVVLFDQKEFEKVADLSKPEALRFAKSAFGKQVRSLLTDQDVELNPNEKRALGIAISTTSNDYIAPAAGADGINNGGVFIPQSVLYDLLETDAPDSPFLRDVGGTHIKGALIFPYVMEAVPVSKGKKESVPADDRSVKWGKLSLAQGNYPLTIEVTMELLGMADEEFADYLLADLSCEINTLLAEEVLYGTGTDDRIAGVAIGAIAGTAYDDGVTDKFCDVIFKSLTKSEIGEEGTFCETLSLERQSYWYEKLETTLALQKTGTAGNTFPLSFPIVFNGWSFIDSVRINNPFHREAPARITIKGAIAGTVKEEKSYIEIQLKSAYSGEVISSVRLERSMEEGETLVIDPESKKITLTDSDGAVTNAYDMTDKTKQSFLYIPQGEFILGANITDKDSGSIEVSVKRYLLD